VAEFAGLTNADGDRGEETVSSGLVNWLVSRDGPWNPLMVPTTQPWQNTVNNLVDMVMTAFEPTGPPPEAGANADGDGGEEALSPRLVDWLVSHDGPWNPLMVPTTRPRQTTVNNLVDMVMTAFEPMGPHRDG